MQESRSRPNYPPLRPGSRFPFKKHAGKRTDEVIVEDPRYIRWCIENTPLELSDECYEALVFAERQLTDNDVMLPSERRERYEERW